MIICALPMTPRQQPTANIPFSSNVTRINIQPFLLHNVPASVAIVLRCISLSSLAGEPTRQKYVAIALAVAGSAYMDGGFGAWEFPTAIAVAFCAARGL
jgi:hypothetical protein